MPPTRNARLSERGSTPTGPTASTSSTSAASATARSSTVSPGRVRGSSKGSKRRVRSSKACETCRARRIRCDGPPPCAACVDAGVGGRCTVRSKARPQRALSAHIYQLGGDESAGAGDAESVGIILDMPSDDGDPGETAAVAAAPTTSSSTRAAQMISPERSSQAATDAEPAPDPRPVQLGHITPVQSPPGMFASASVVSPFSALRDHTTPLDEVEDALSAWCMAKDINLWQLVFKADTRFSDTPGSPLPPTPELYEYEDALFQYFMSSDELAHQDHLQMVEPAVFLSLYQRYRALPHTLTDDQTAIVYAALCSARFAQIRHAINEGTPLREGAPSREDITYYHMACETLKRWARPSLNALRALFCLNMFTIGIGGPGETKAMMRQLAWQIRELGLNQQCTAALYPQHEQVGMLYSSFFYTDLFRASLTDLEPSIPLGESDVDPTPPSTLTISRALGRCSYFTAKYLADYADPAVDVTTLEYAMATEEQWAPHIRQLRLGGTDAPREVGWAEFRYNWLRILLYIPHLHRRDAPRPASLAYGAIARSITQILYTYADLAACQQLNPSWPQVQRLVVCGQLLILCQEAGELQAGEARTLFRMLVNMLRKHEDTWPYCGELVLGFSAAAHVFGLDLAPAPSADVDLLDAAGVSPLDPFQWTDLGFDFDFSSLPV